MTFKDSVRDRLAVTEGVRNFIYLDTRGIPTTSRGIALLTSDWVIVANVNQILENMGNSAAQISKIKQELSLFDNAADRSAAQKNFFDTKVRQLTFVET